MTCNARRTYIDREVKNQIMTDECKARAAHDKLWETYDSKLNFPFLQVLVPD